MQVDKSNQESPLGRLIDRYSEVFEEGLGAFKCPKAGAHHKKNATTPYSCHGVFTDRSIFSLNLSRIQIPTGTSVTNCNHKHGPMLACRHDVDMFT